MKYLFKYNFSSSQTKWLSLLVALSMVIMILSGCTPSTDQHIDVLTQNLDDTLSTNYNIIGTINQKELTLYRQLQLDSQKTKADGDKTQGFGKSPDQFCYSDDAIANQIMGINRYNYGDSLATEWVDTAYKYNLTTNQEYKDIQIIADMPPTKDKNTGVLTKDAETIEIKTDIDILIAIKAEIESMSYKKVSLNSRIGKDIIRIESEVIFTTEGKAIYDVGKDNFVAPISNSVVKNSSKLNEYNWESGDSQILHITFFRLDFSVVDGRIVDVEGVIEEIKNLPFDKRNFAKQGRIYTVTKPTIYKETIINIKVS